MDQFKNAPPEDIELLLNSQVVEMAEYLGMDLSQTVNDLLAAEVIRVRNARNAKGDSSQTPPT
ncbi:type II toxin-antitoxin system CcdA family antitoxin [Variovorax sp. J22R133]|uniref:type II toxin-antitoxin system CcdA family antitoxin n=1 Tax=Variovorax brevis TaxID=3053503 RepID=UPI002577E4F8|nr:type II toxin-antitoxin system CcdA family antitoxin [Variovorax sp. J22R133]MDM0113469.1 type II toxin-antitoxin system CcdA family antitoxin [Variovorax sp. J22R133]